MGSVFLNGISPTSRSLNKCGLDTFNISAACWVLISESEEINVNDLP